MTKSTTDSSQERNLGTRPRQKLEIAVQDVQGARTAATCGADRVELCAALASTGGITPGYGIISLCTKCRVPSGVQVLIRPRGGSFVFDADDKAMQLAEIGPALQAGASGVVVGGLTDNGDIDIPFARDLLNEAQEQAGKIGTSVDVTFHRAFDMASDQSTALEELISLGYTRILTSGGAPSVPEGLDALEELVRQADGRIQIMAGGGCTPERFHAIMATGVDAIHLSARRVTKSDGGPGGGGTDTIVEHTDPSIVRDCVERIRRH